MTLLIVLILAMILGLVAIVAYAVILFNDLVQVKHNVDQAWANIDVLLKERHDEIPKLIDAAKVYMEYEKEVLGNITALRSRAAQGGEDAGRLQTEQKLGAALTRLFAVAENYPSLKADQSFLALEGRISAIEEQIARRREFYNDSANINNVRMEQFPEVFFAALAGLRTRPMFQATAEEQQDVNVKEYFSH